MKEKHNIPWDLLVKFATHAATQEEEKQVSLWIEKDPGPHQQILQDILAIYDVRKFDLTTARHIFNRVNAAANLHPVALLQEKPASGKKVWFRNMPIAAAVIIMIALLAITWNYMIGPAFQKPDIITQIAWKEEHVPNGKMKVIILSDSTIVTLLPGSTIRYPEQYAPQERTVFIEGSAFFQVSHCPEKPFTVTTRGLRTKVLGTEFLIENYSEDKAASVTVVSGKVAVDTGSGQVKDPYILTMNQRITFSEGKVSRTIVSENTARSIQSSGLAFDNESLSVIGTRLARYYGIEVRITNIAISKRKFTASFAPDSSLQEVIQVFREVSGRNFEWSPDSRQLTIR